MVVLFKENWDTTLSSVDRKSALKALIQSIRSIHPTVLIAVDHEGGAVWRFEERFTKLPAAKTFGQRYDEDISALKKDALKHAFDSGRSMASELIDWGIDLSLAPVFRYRQGESSN